MASDSDVQDCTCDCCTRKQNPDKDKYLAPCPCEGCKAGNHCWRCLNGNVGDRFMSVPDDYSGPEAGQCVRAWFHTCFPQYRRKDGRVILQEDSNG